MDALMGPQPAQDPPHCTINDQCTNHRIAV